jgi:putative methionine-R-sulfoxide reductase with GAF domain
MTENKNKEDVMVFMNGMQTGAGRMARLEVETTQNERDSLQLLMEITKAITAELELPKLLQLVMDKTRTALNADRCSVYLADYDKQELWTIVAQGMDDREIRLPLSKGLAGYVACTGETVNIKDAYHDPRFDRETDHRTGYHTVSMLALPLKNKNNVIIGVVQLLNKNIGYFTKTDTELLESVAAVAVIAIENAQLYRRAKSTIFDKVIEALSQSRYETDPIKLNHAKRVSKTAQTLAAGLGLKPEQQQVLWYASMLHDVVNVDALRELFIYEGNVPALKFWTIAETINAAKKVLGSLQTHGLARQVHAQPQGPVATSTVATLEAQIVAFCDLADTLLTHDTRKGKKDGNPLALLLSDGVARHFDRRIVQHFLCNYAEFLNEAA